MRPPKVSWAPLYLQILQILSEDDRNVIGITDSKIAAVVRSICGSSMTLGSSINDFSVVGVHITNPLEQMRAL